MVNSLVRKSVYRGYSNPSDYYCQGKSNLLDNSERRVFHSPVDWKAVGRRIKDVTKNQNIAELAESIGIHDKTMYLWMKGKGISVDKLLALVLTLPRRVSLDWLLTEEGPMYLTSIEAQTNKPEPKLSPGIRNDSLESKGCKLFHALPPKAQAEAVAILEVLHKSHFPGDAKEKQRAENRLLKQQQKEREEIAKEVRDKIDKRRG